MSENIKLAQMFDVDGFTPSKTSVYLKRAGDNASNFFDLIDGSFAADATNFSDITQGTNKFILQEESNGFTDNGYLAVIEEPLVASVDSWPSVHYPVRTSIPQGYFIFVRGLPEGGLWNAILYVDDVRVDEVDESGLVDSWQWFQFNVGIPDTETHILSIQLKVQGSGIDKLYVSEVDAYGVDIPTGEGPDLTVSPYATLHLQVYTTDASLVPISAISTYDWKTTREEVTTDDWYNFDLTMLNGSFPGDGTYAIVMSSSGGSETNFVIWDMLDNDEYTSSPSAIRA